MKRFFCVAAVLFLVCSVGFSQKIRVQSRNPHEHFLSMMSYNIRHGKGMDGKVDLARIAKEISLIEPDVVALQEVDKGTNRIGGVDSPAEIAKLAGGYYATFASAMDFDGGQYGNAIISKKAPLSSASVALPGSDEPRVMLIAEFEDFYFCSVHLSLDSLSRVESCRKIADIAGKVTRGRFKLDGKSVFSGTDKPFYIAGDFNFTPNSTEIRVLAGSFGVLSSLGQYTFPSDNPTRTLDYIMLFKSGSGKAMLKKLEKSKLGIVYWVQPEMVASDHRPLFLVLFKGETVSSVISD